MKARKAAARQSKSAEADRHHYWQAGFDFREEHQSVAANEKIPAEATAQDDLRLTEVFLHGGSMLWTRPDDGRWYMVSGLLSLFGEMEAEYRWGGVGRPPSRIIRQPITGGPDDLLRLARQICRRRAARRYSLVSR